MITIAILLKVVIAIILIVIIAIILIVMIAIILTVIIAILFIVIIAILLKVGQFGRSSHVSYAGLCIEFRLHCSGPGAVKPLGAARNFSEKFPVERFEAAVSQSTVPLPPSSSCKLPGIRRALSDPEPPSRRKSLTIEGNPLL